MPSRIVPASIAGTSPTTPRNVTSGASFSSAPQRPASGGVKDDDDEFPELDALAELCDDDDALAALPPVDVAVVAPVGVHAVTTAAINAFFVQASSNLLMEGTLGCNS